MTGHDWRDSARCRGADTELFFPGKDSILPEEAAALCAACPVRGDCLEWALGHPQYGVWGGTTRDDRHATRRRGQRKTRREETAA